MNLLFNEIGNLPPERYEMTFNEAKTFFVDTFPDSETRLENWNCFIEYVKNLITLGINDMQIWIDGSFVTDKINPNDIDCVLYISVKLLNSLNKQQQSILSNVLVPQKRETHELIKQAFHTDPYLLLDVKDCPEHLNYHEIVKMKEYWEGWWGHDRQGNAKGYIILSVKGGRRQ